MNVFLGYPLYAHDDIHICMYRVDASYGGSILVEITFLTSPYNDSNGHGY